MDGLENVEIPLRYESNSDADWHNLENYLQSIDRTVGSAASRYRDVISGRGWGEMQDIMQEGRTGLFVAWEEKQVLDPNSKFNKYFNKVKTYYDWSTDEVKINEVNVFIGWAKKRMSDYMESYIRRNIHSYNSKPRQMANNTLNFSSFQEQKQTEADEEYFLDWLSIRAFDYDPVDTYTVIDAEDELNIPFVGLENVSKVIGVDTTGFSENDADPLRDLLFESALQVILEPSDTTGKADQMLSDSSDVNQVRAAIFKAIFIDQERLRTVFERLSQEDHPLRYNWKAFIAESRSISHTLRGSQDRIREVFQHKMNIYKGLAPDAEKHDLEKTELDKLRELTGLELAGFDNSDATKLRDILNESVSETLGSRKMSTGKGRDGKERYRPLKPVTIQREKAAFKAILDRLSPMEAFKIFHKEDPQVFNSYDNFKEATGRVKQKVTSNWDIIVSEFDKRVNQYTKER